MTSSLVTTAQTPAPAEKPVVTAFIHIIGCPAGKQELFIFIAENGKTKVIHMFDEEITQNSEAIKKLIGDVNGYNRKFECGVSI